jgi:hypothetical protein
VLSFVSKGRYHRLVFGNCRIPKDRASVGEIILNRILKQRDARFFVSAAFTMEAQRGDLRIAWIAGGKALKLGLLRGLI